MAADFTYTINDGFYSVYPETRQAEPTISRMIEAFGSNKLTFSEFLEFRRQARSAGYGIGKGKRSTIPDDELAAALL